MKLGVFTFVFCLFVSYAHAHPGKTDTEGCHVVAKDYKYKSGKVLKAGSEHCHATMGKMKFDGKQVLEDPEPSKQKKGSKK